MLAGTSKPLSEKIKKYSVPRYGMLDVVRCN